MRRGIRAGWSAAATGLTRRRQHLLQPLADEAASANRAGEQIRIVGIVDLAVVELLEFLGAATARDMSGHVLLLLFGRPGAHGQYLRRTDHAKFRCRVVDRCPSVGDSQRSGGRIAAARDVAVAHRRQDAWQQVAVGDQCAVTLDRQIAPGQPGVADQGTHDVGIQAAGRDHRGLHGNRLEFRAWLARKDRRKSSGRRSTGVHPVAVRQPPRVGPRVRRRACPAPPSVATSVVWHALQPPGPR